jgi:hypothetical protein
MRKLFQSEADATFFMSLITGMLMVYYAAQERAASELKPLLVSGLLLLGPALATRSWRRLLCAAVFYIGAVFAGPSLYGVFFVINGRESLPLTVWGAPTMAISVPWPSMPPNAWPYRALFMFGLFWAWIGTALVVMRQVPSVLPITQRLRAGVFAVVSGVALALVLFRISWAARVSGTFALPLYTSKAYYFSLTAYYVLYATTPCFILCMYDWLLNQQKMTQSLLDMEDSEREYREGQCAVMTADETVEWLFS